jgi:hypothetical protein
MVELLEKFYIHKYSPPPIISDPSVCTDCMREMQNIYLNGIHYFICSICNQKAENHEKNEKLDIHNNDMITDVNIDRSSGKVSYSQSKVNMSARSIYSNDIKAQEQNKKLVLKKELICINEQKMQKMIPINCIDETIDLYFEAIKSKTKRKNNKNKILGASLQIVAKKKYAIGITNMDICQFFGIDQSSLIDGQSVVFPAAIDLGYYEEAKRGERDKDRDTIDSYLDKFFIYEPNHRKFVIEMFTRINEKNIIEIKSTQPLSRIIAIIVMLIELTGKFCNPPRSVNHTYVQEKGIKLTEATYKSLINKIYSYEKIFRKVFIRNEIPFPSKWKSTEDYTKIVNHVFKIEDEKKLGIINQFINRTIDKGVITVEKKDTLDIPCIAYIFLVKLFKFGGNEFNSKNLITYNKSIESKYQLYNKLITKYKLAG